MGAFLGLLGFAILIDVVFNQGDAIKGIIRAVRGK